MGPLYSYGSRHSRYPWVHAALSMTMGGRGVPPPDYHEELLASSTFALATAINYSNC